MAGMPDCEYLMLERKGARLDVVFNRPDQRNAINVAMGEEISRTVEWLADADDVRVVVLRGAGGHFCAGGDIKERAQMAAIPADVTDPVMERNLEAGLGFLAFENLPQTTIAAVEGSAFGGGLGYACLADITIVTRGARLGMPETTLGVAPAQIAPFVVKRLGLTKARQLALTAERFDGEAAHAMGLAHYLCDDGLLDQTTDDVVAQVLKCGGKANAATKDIMLKVGILPPEEMIRYSAQKFAELNRGEEAREGQAAFAQKRKPRWQEDGS